jgi:hypothetical protein
MQNYFIAGNEIVHWDLEIIGAKNRHLKLTVRHGQGSIVEYFNSAEAALRRERELEDLLIAARGRGGSQPELAVAQ